MRDGTSIVLSDDVGQIYIINTGQGDSLKDAEYDQFFLGDYRPLVQDTHGNVLDQETQLVPYRRNIQDLLCDSSMIPYPEPYQSMYQRRRLGALGIEWRPTSVNLAVGPGDISGFLDYHIPPLADLDTFFEPLPEFIDAMEWEPEIEIQSDDNDSEYNVTDEYSSELEREGLSNGSYGDPECSAEDSETREDFRRSKRKKHRASDAEIMTSSGRRVKRRNLDERDSTLPLCNKTRKSKHKSSKRKSLKSKSSRPQRVAARNALNFFSRIGEASTDEEDEDNSESDSSDSESMVQELNIHSGESDRAIHKSLRGKEMLFDESVHAIKHSESQVTGGSKMRLVVKFSARSANNIVPPNDCDKQLDLNPLRSQDPGPSARDGEIENRCEGEVEDRIVEDMSAGYMDSKIRWGEVKARTSKRLRLGEPMKMETLPEGLNTTIDNDNSIGNTEALPAGPNTPLDSINRILNNVNHNLEPKSEPASGTQSHGDKRVFMAGNLEGERNEEFAVHQRRRVESPFTGNGNVYKEYANCMDYDEPLKDGGDYSQHVQERELPINENLRFKSKIIWKNSGTPPIAAGENCGSSGYNLEHRSSLESSISGVPEENAGLSESSEDHENRNGFENLEARTSRTRLTNVQDTKKLHSDTNRKMYNAVYKRSKSYRARADSEGDGGGMEESTSNANNRTRDPRTDCSEGATNGIRTRSMGIKIAREPNSFFEARGDPPGSVGTSNRGEKLSLDTHEMLWRSNSKLTVGLRSTRNRRGSNFESDINSSVKKVSHDPMKKLSWMLLTEHEEFYRYIPQQGDEVAYLRQGHEQYLEWHRSKEKGPWRTLKGNLKDVEFCKVIDLDYSTVPGSGDSCCKITFEFIDSSSTVFGKTFQMTLLELNNFPDFIVERARYDSAISRNWTNRDKCQVWWRNGVGEGGSWWEGRIVSVKAQSLDFPESPWERFHVKYKNDSTGDHEHSPWEFHDPGSTWEHPRIDGWSKNTLISSFAELEQSRRSIKRDYYGIQKLKQVWQKSDFYNRFPVPLTFETINSRLENNYYRTLEAVKHDFGVMLGNAESYFGKSMELGTKLKQLSKWFDETMSTVTPIEADN
ncbi:hypothetical protein GIB67_001284 [Kingdonia uniflora]|uniref:Bromo domain-containing protein n=1 Tax=Kingdonia uniflora TaxID=39325 RepID=A0A7J7LLC8_9MAGN|nr:hypothetical protein GIB67_001284 [Kingdonia uniflora]